MNLGGELALEFGGLVEDVPGVLGPVGVVVVPVDEFVEDQVSGGMGREVGKLDELAEVGAVVVEVTGHPDLSVGRKGDDLGLAERGESVLVTGCGKGLDDLVGVEWHARMMRKKPVEGKMTPAGDDDQALG
jgi:hypothetical protein